MKLGFCVLWLLTGEARPRTGILLALASQTARMFQIVRYCHIVTTACMGLAGVSNAVVFCFRRIMLVSTRRRVSSWLCIMNELFKFGLLNLNSGWFTCREKILIVEE